MSDLYEAYNLTAFIDIMSWSFSLGGEHYTGKIHRQDRGVKGIEITYKMSRSDAIKLNKKDRTSRLFKHKAGDDCGRFWTREGIIQAGVKLIEDKWPDIILVLVGSSASYSPEEVVKAPTKKIMQKLNNINNKMEKLHQESKFMLATPDGWDEMQDKWEEAMIDLILPRVRKFKDKQC